MWSVRVSCRPYTRSGGAPNCAPSLRSVAGLLGRSLAAAYEDTLTSLHRSVTARAFRRVMRSARTIQRLIRTAVSTLPRRLEVRESFVRGEAFDWVQ